MHHLLVDISAHGFGHVAQTAAVLNSLDCTDIRLTIRSATAERILRQRIHHPFQLIPYQQDNGMVMRDALQVDAVASLRWYAAFHDTYMQRKVQAMRDLEKLKPDLLFANIPYLGLDAAGELGIPSVALCSLNWADVFHAYCGHMQGAGQIREEILHAYRQAEVFLQPEPSMTMDASLYTQGTAPIALHGRVLPDILREKSGIPAITRFVLVALGGIGVEYPLERWPVLPGVGWIFPDAALHMQRADFLPQSLFGMEYVDLLASCNAVITKTGYGTQTEAVINQVPTLCILRSDWPEEPNLPDWHAQQGEVIFTDWQDIQAGTFASKIEALLETVWHKPGVIPMGASEAAVILQSRLYG